MAKICGEKKTVVSIDVQVPIEKGEQVNVGPGYWFWGKIKKEWYKKDPKKPYLMWCRCGCVIECFDPDGQERNFTVGIGEVAVISQANAKIVIEE